MMLVLIPILSSAVTLFVHNLKELSEITVSSLMTFAILVIYGPVVVYEEGYLIYLEFD